MSDQQPHPQPQNLPPQPQWGPPQQPGQYPPPPQGPDQQPGHGQAPHPRPGYGQPAYGQAPYPQAPYNQAPYPQAPYGFGYGHPYGAVVPQSMPGAVRAAQVVIFSMGGLSALGSVIMGAVSGAEAAGYAIGANLCGWVLVVFAFLFDSGRRGVRVTSIVFASIQILFGLGSIGAHRPAGVLPGLAAAAVVVLLSQGSAGQWFGRPRIPRPGQGYAA
ncbi:MULTISPECIES: hypothetical protein [unclassified Streptomyces]|uniref:hypothetical protein n=1 Tax=unclassified Streptomyces TaxID=2593676 RepID=UPI00382584E7